MNLSDPNQSNHDLKQATYRELLHFHECIQVPTDRTFKLY